MITDTENQEKTMREPKDLIILLLLGIIFVFVWNLEIYLVQEKKMEKKHISKTFYYDSEAELKSHIYMYKLLLTRLKPQKGRRYYENY